MTYDARWSAETAPRPMTRRRTAVRLAVTLLLLSPLLGAVPMADALGALDVTGTDLTPADPFADAPDAAWWVGPLLVAACVAYAGTLARLVDYRFRDGLFSLVPVLGWIFVVRFCWRVSALPERRWPPASVRTRNGFDDLTDRVVAKMRRPQATS